jgi:hypothetical protein
MTTDANTQDAHSFESLMSMSESDRDALLLNSQGPADDSMTVGGEVVVKAETNTPDPEGDTTQVDSSAAPAAAKVEDVKPQGVLAKDNEHILPFKVVEDLRQSKSELEQRVRDQEAQLAELRAAKPGDVVDADVLKDHEFLSEEQLAELEEDMPALAKTLRTTQSALTSLLTQQANDRKQREQEEQQRQNTVREAVRTNVQAAIDATPVLLHLQTTDPLAFERAKEIDIERSKNPSTAALWNAMPLEERFKQLVVDYEARFGKVAVPSLPAPTPASATPAAETKPTPKPSGPLSLSDLPGGASPATDAREEMGGKNGAEIIADMSKWSPAQLDAYFANI